MIFDCKGNAFPLCVKTGNEIIQAMLIIASLLENPQN